MSFGILGLYFVSDVDSFVLETATYPLLECEVHNLYQSCLGGWKQKLRVYGVQHLFMILKMLIYNWLGLK